MKKFKDFDDAVKQLKDYLPNLRDSKTSILLGLSDSKGYLSPLLAHKLHVALNVQFDFLFVEKIHSPVNKHCIIGMISETGNIYTNDALINFLDIENDYIYSESSREYENITSSSHVIKEHDLVEKIKNKDVYLVDYGICSALKMACAIESVVHKDVKSVNIISPVIAEGVFDHLYSLVDNIYYVHKMKNFVSKKFYYKELEKTDIESISEL